MENTNQTPAVSEFIRNTSAMHPFERAGLGIAILVQTARHGGGLGYVIGVLFVALGAGRLYLLRHRR